LEHLVVRKKEIRDQFEELVLICGGFLEHRGMGGAMVWGKRIRKGDSRAQEWEMAVAKQE
jgi:hypothetical protein